MLGRVVDPACVCVEGESWKSVPVGAKSGTRIPNTGTVPV